MNTPSSMSAWMRLGGEEPLRRLITVFVARMRNDVMIGFFFGKVRSERLVELELQHASGHLGGPLQYTGRPLRQAHRHLKLGRGHFLRRRTLLGEVLAQHHVPPEVAAGWLAAQDALAHEVLGPPDDSACPTR